jgi:hypothetical protein
MQDFKTKILTMAQARQFWKFLDADYALRYKVEEGEGEDEFYVVVYDLSPEQIKKLEDYQNAEFFREQK